MKPSKKRAFTLIELLVVIAIIAILAAILFPVFAQAKAAAKATVSLSNCKQMGTGQLMYMNDNDDQFSPISEFGGASADDQVWQGRPFSYLQQPYMKSWGLVMDPLSPATVNSDPWVIRSQWAMPPMRTDTKSTSADDWVMGTTAQGAQFTGNRKYYFDGIAGVAKAAGYGGWEAADYQEGNYPSMSQTAVGSPADMAMIVMAGTYDMMWQYTSDGDFGKDAPDNWDLYWGDAPYNLYGMNAMICGPMARVRGSGESAGVIPFTADAAAKAKLPTGNTVYCAVDGHAKNVAWRQMMGSTIQLSDGRLAIKAFWPNP